MPDNMKNLDSRGFEKDAAASNDASSQLTPLQKIQRLWFLLSAARQKREQTETSEREQTLEKDNVRLQDELRKLSRREAYSRYLANHDGLTGLCNRSLLLDRFVHAAAHARRCGHPIAVLLFDLDGFKSVNDRFGHLAGDKLLQRIAKRLSTIARADDTVCRYGGDEFIMLVQGIDSAEIAKTVARRVQEDIVDCLRVDAIQADVSTSVGIAMYPDDGDNWNALMEAADRAMYQCKPATEHHDDSDESRHDARWRLRHERNTLLRVPYAATAPRNSSQKASTPGHAQVVESRHEKD